MTDTEAARAWVAKLAPLVNPGNPEITAKAFAGMLEMMQDVPDRVWRSRKALDYVATAERPTRVPTLKDLRIAIWQWIRSNPDTLAITDASKADWSPMDHEWLDYFRMREAAGFGQQTVGTHTKTTFHPTTRAHCLSLVRSQSPKAYRAIMGDAVSRA